jgi:hypothetical protein
LKKYLSHTSQIIDQLGLQSINTPQTFARNMTRFTLSCESKPESLEDISHRLHIAGNILIGLESCLSKRDQITFEKIVRQVIPYAKSSFSFPFPPSISGTQPQDRLTLEELQNFEPRSTDLIPCYVYQFESVEMITPLFVTRIKQICGENGVKTQEWSESQQLVRSSDSDRNYFRTKNIWNFSYQEGYLSQTNEGELRTKKRPSDDKIILQRKYSQVLQTIQTVISTDTLR